MKIAIIVSHFPQVSETFILNRITGLLNRGHDVQIFAYDKGASSSVHPDVKDYGLLDRTHYFNIPRQRLWRVLKALALFVRYFFKSPRILLRSVNVFKYGKEAASLRLLYGTLPFIEHPSFDVIHSHHGPNGLKDTWLRQIGAVQGMHVTSFHGADATRHIQQHGDHVYTRLFEKGDLFLTVSEGMRKQLIRVGADAEKVMVHHSGVDLKRFSYRDSGFKRGQCLKIVSIGRLIEKKGFEYSICAVAKVSKRISLSYNIVGEGELQQPLQKLIDELEAPNVRLLGGRDQNKIIEILRDSHMLLAPSVESSDGNKEGIPNVVKEAMAVGLPVIATRHGDISELIENGVNGFLVEEKNADELGERLLWLVEHPEIWRGICQSARRKVEDGFDVEKLNGRLCGYYQVPASGRQASPSQ